MTTRTSPIMFTGEPMTRPLTHEEKLWVFRQATRTFANSGTRWAERAAHGMTDAELEDALRYELGIMGSRSGPGEPSIAYQGAGLRIWGSWQSISLVRDRPLFKGRATVAMARQVYGIRNPADRQMSLL